MQPNQVGDQAGVGGVFQLGTRPDQQPDRRDLKADRPDRQLLGPDLNQTGSPGTFRFELRLI